MSAPAYRAYTVIKREGKDDYWLNIGVAFAHEDTLAFPGSEVAPPTRNSEKRYSCPADY